MKKILTLSYLCIVFSLVSCQTKTYTIVQYNVGAFSKYDESSIEAVALAAKEMGADVITVNEVDSCTTRTGQVDQLAVLADTLGGWNYHFVSAIPYKGGAYGVGVVGKNELDVVRTDRVALPKFDGYETRAVAVVEYEDFVLCSTHLDLTVESQLGQVKVLNHYIDSVYADCRKPIFLGGDFNCFPDSKPVELLKQSWQLMTPATTSFPSHAPDRCIDFIFVRPQGREVTVSYTEIPLSLQSVNLATASDHLPVVATVEIR